MKKNLLIIACLVLSIGASFAQGQHKIAFYNLENFFDLIDDPEVNDDEFLPNSAKKWNQEKYDIKLNNMSRVFFDMSALDKIYPAVIGVCEVETRSVLEDIASTPKLAPARYSIAHVDSPERRGVDAAFMYRPEIFKKEGEKSVRTIIENRPDYITRDIMTMWGKIDGEDFFFMVCHWPSRYGGAEYSSPSRISVGRQMRQIADSVRNLRPSTKVIAMGDFNDDPIDYSLEMALGAKGSLEEMGEGDFYNPFMKILQDGFGTLAYRDAWNLFDNIVVSDNLTGEGDNELKIQKGKKSKYYGNIFRQHYMFQKTGQFKNYPLRTYVGNNFRGGFSDHLPVYIYIGK